MKKVVFLAMMLLFAAPVWAVVKSSTPAEIETAIAATASAHEKTQLQLRLAVLAAPQSYTTYAAVKDKGIELEKANKVNTNDHVAIYYCQLYNVFMPEAYADAQGTFAELYFLIYQSPGLTISEVDRFTGIAGCLLDRDYSVKSVEIALDAMRKYGRRLPAATKIENYQLLWQKYYPMYVKDNAQYAAVAAEIGASLKALGVNVQ